jgi:hypothetical protein|tara:strand:- start:148 stop:315 length:168 start_codon:yes stop_codon:yes gene_type:complete
MAKLLDEITTTDRFVLFINWLVKVKKMGALAIVDAVEKPYRTEIQELFDEFRGDV